VKRILLAAAALGLVIVSVVAGREKPSLPEVAQPAARLDTRIELDLAKLEARAGEGAKADPFAQRSFADPAAAAQPQPPAKPAAPPLPFVYVGKVLEDGKLSVFLARGAENFSVSAGDTIGGEYRVDAVTQNEIRFTYLPLKTKQSLPL
jgi:hypothetical protein